MSGNPGGIETMEMNAEIKDRLAMALNNDWKNFGMEILHDNQIKMIDIDERSVYEKCYTMLTQWEKESKVPVTVGMVIQILMRLKRNDIWKTLQDEFPSLDQLHISSSQKDIFPLRNEYSQEIPKKELKISELRMRHLEQIAAKLDHSSGVGITNWKNLAHELIDKKPNLIIKDLELHYFGGGNPALEFLMLLARRKPDLTVGQLKDACRSFKRMDIVIFIDSELAINDQLRYIESSKREKLASYLNLNSPGVYNWEIFADEYGFNNDDIKQIKSVIKEKQSYSPTKRLFELLKQIKPDMTVDTVIQACRKIGRNDVVHVLEST